MKVISLANLEVKNTSVVHRASCLKMAKTSFFLVVGKKKVLPTLGGPSFCHWSKYKFKVRYRKVALPDAKLGMAHFSLDLSKVKRVLQELDSICLCYLNQLASTKPGVIQTVDLKKIRKVEFKYA